MPDSCCACLAVALMSCRAEHVWTLLSHLDLKACWHVCHKLMGVAIDQVDKQWCAACRQQHLLGQQSVTWNWGTSQDAIPNVESHSEHECKAAPHSGGIAEGVCVHEGTRQPSKQIAQQDGQTRLLISHHNNTIVQQDGTVCRVAWSHCLSLGSTSRASKRIELAACKRARTACHAGLRHSMPTG